jgi:nitrogen-specific signal transduction histidine kinase
LVNTDGREKPMKRVQANLNNVVERVRTCLAPSGTYECRWELSDERLTVLLDPARLGHAILALIAMATEIVSGGGCIAVSTKPLAVRFVGSEGGDNRGACILLSLMMHPRSFWRPSGKSLDTLKSVREVVKEHGGCLSRTRSTSDGVAFHLYLPRLFPDAGEEESLNSREVILSTPASVVSRAPARY